VNAKERSQPWGLQPSRKPFEVAGGVRILVHVCTKRGRAPAARIQDPDGAVTTEWRFYPNSLQARAHSPSRLQLPLNCVFGTMEGMSESLDPLRRTFDTAADLYEAARPSYPNELFDDLVELAELEPGMRLLEIGCATGKATRPLLERGFSIVCVEMGEHLAAQARRNLARLPVEIDVAPFEAWQAESESFDLVYAATA
jgi:protein-L-isoaspartate O-methyltransferase